MNQTVTAPSIPQLSDNPNLLDITGWKGNFVAVHTLATHAGVNLNRDMDGLPKTITLGGVTRMRLSAASRVRAARTYARNYTEKTDQASARSRLLPQEIARYLVKSHDLDVKKAEALAVYIVHAAGMSIDASQPDRTRAITYLPETAVVRLGQLVLDVESEHTDAIEATQQAISAHQATLTEGKRGKKKDLPALPEVPKALTAAARTQFAPGVCAEIALFGRMLSELPGGQVYSAVQVAHAIGVDEMEMITDDFTVVDDWQDFGVFGSANQGQHYLASGTVYSYAALDRRTLRATLANGVQDPDELERLAQWAEQLFVTSIAYAVPGGKRSRTGPAMLPTLVLAATTDQPLTAAPAFEDAITGPAGLEASRRLCAYLNNAQSRAPLHGGKALWLSPLGEDAPTMPSAITLDA